MAATQTTATRVCLQLLCPQPMMCADMAKTSDSRLPPLPYGPFTWYHTMTSTPLWVPEALSVEPPST